MNLRVRRSPNFAGLAVHCGGKLRVKTLSRRWASKRRERNAGVHGSRAAPSHGPYDFGVTVAVSPRRHSESEPRYRLSSADELQVRSLGLLVTGYLGYRPPAGNPSPPILETCCSFPLWSGGRVIHWPRGHGQVPDTIPRTPPPN